MNSINVFGKQINELHINFIQEFIDKLKVKTPEDEEFHIAMDEQLKIDKELIKVIFKNINKKTKKINNKDTPKKTPKFNCWRLFCAQKSKEFPDASQSEKWGLASAEWAELKLNGGDQHWKELADTLNREAADSDTSVVSDTSATSVVSDTSDTTSYTIPIEEEQSQPINAEAKTKKITTKTNNKSAPKGKKNNKKTQDNDNNEIHVEHPEVSLD
jgi:hypothetical protein